MKHAAGSDPKRTGNAQPEPSPAGCKVKNTFLEFSMPEAENEKSKRRTMSDTMGGHGQDLRNSPLVVASKSPTCSPLLQPVDETRQAMPIDEVNFELLEEAVDIPGDCDVIVETRQPFTGNAPLNAKPRKKSADGSEAPIAQASAGMGRDEPAYVVPTTPSPFLHSSFPPTVVPPFGYYGGGGMLDGLPPAYQDGEGGQGAGEGFGMQDVDGQYMQGMPWSPEMWDPSLGYCPPYGWPMPGAEGADASGFAEMQAEMLEQVASDGRVGSGPSVDGGGFRGQGGQDKYSSGGGGEDGAGVERSNPKEGRNRGKGRREAREEERARALVAPGGGNAGGRGAGKGGYSSTNVDTGDDERIARRGDLGGGVEKSGREHQYKPAQRPDANTTYSMGEDGQMVEEYTTVMLRNIPNKYTREMLIKQLTQEFHGLFDFMYLPIDFKNKCNVGYGFINFRTPEACERFVSQFHGVDVRKCLPGLNSKKIVEVTPARVQGLQENVRRLRNSPVMNQLQDHPEWMPLLFNEFGEEEPFPMPDQPLPPVKPRGRNREVRDERGI